MRENKKFDVVAANARYERAEEGIIKAARVHFEGWVKRPEEEDYIFNRSVSIIEVCSAAYQSLLILKRIDPIEKLDDKLKQELKSEVFRISPNCDEKKGIKIAKTLYVFGYLCNVKN